MIPINSKTKKASKSDAFAHMQALHRGETLSTPQVESLLLYFAPPMPKKAKTAMEWLAKAAGKEDVRFYLNYIWVGADGVGYGTDGHAAHRAQLEGVAEGFYCPKTLLPATNVDGTYPNMERLFARGETHYTVDYNELSSNMLNGGVATYSHEQSHVNKVLLDRAMNGDHQPITMVAVPSGASTALHKWYGSNEFGTFLVMGIRDV